MKVTPIIAPALDWMSFVTEAHSALGRSPTASLALAGLKPGTAEDSNPLRSASSSMRTPPQCRS